MSWTGTRFQEGLLPNRKPEIEEHKKTGVSRFLKYKVVELNKKGIPFQGFKGVAA